MNLADKSCFEICPFLVRVKRVPTGIYAYQTERNDDKRGGSDDKLLPGLLQLLRPESSAIGRIFIAGHKEWVSCLTNSKVFSCFSHHDMAQFEVKMRGNKAAVEAS